MSFQVTIVYQVVCCTSTYYWSFPHFRYRGYCPTIKYDYGETYGNATSRYFQDYRSSVLNSSASNYSPGGSFPTYYTHCPDLVLSNRCRNRDRWLLAPKYQLSNMDHDRTEQLRSLDTVRTITDVLLLCCLHFTPVKGALPWGIGKLGGGRRVG